MLGAMPAVRLCSSFANALEPIRLIHRGQAASRRSTRAGERPATAPVGTDETAELFLRGLHAVVRRFGFMDVLFLDRGPGFRADDTAAACHRLDIHLVLGTAAYPEGHGKIEKFNQTAQAQLLRGLVGADDVDDDCGALELRLSHFPDHGYNR